MIKIIREQTTIHSRNLTGEDIIVGKTKRGSVYFLVASPKKANSWFWKGIKNSGSYLSFVSLSGFNITEFSSIEEALEPMEECYVLKNITEIGKVLNV